MASREAHLHDPAPVLRAINDSLRGPVIAAIQRCVPELRGFEHDELFERVMNTPELADQCFKVFRANRGQFEALLVGPAGQPVTDDQQTLSCGRSLAQVVTLIVRAIARRHFRARLDHKADRRFAPGSGRRGGMIERAVEFLGLEQKLMSRRRSAEDKPASLGERLYRAFYDYLLFEWQVRLIPEYASVPIEVLPEIAPFLHSAREPEAVRALVVTRKPAMPEPVAPPIPPGMPEPPPRGGDAAPAPRMPGRAGPSVDAYPWHS